MSTLAVVEEVLRETAVPMSVREIVERAGARLPSKSKTPDTVVARDLSMDIKKKGEASMFTRTSPGRYTLRTLAQNAVPTAVPLAASDTGDALSAIASSGTTGPRPVPAVPAATPIAPVMSARKPAVPSPSSQSASAAGAVSREGGGYVS
jgi:hypothetical protein